MRKKLYLCTLFSLVGSGLRQETRLWRVEGHRTSSSPQGLKSSGAPEGKRKENINLFINN